MTDPQQPSQHPAGGAGLPPAAPFGGRPGGSDAAPWSRRTGPDPAASGTGSEPTSDTEPAQKLPTQAGPEPADTWHDAQSVSPGPEPADAWHDTQEVPQVDVPPVADTADSGSSDRPRPRRSRAPIVAVALALALLGAVFGWRYIQSQRFEQELAVDTAAAHQVVESYFAALRDGDAEAALATSTHRPADASLLTDDVLRSALGSGGLQDITVGAVALANDKRIVGDAGTVVVSYTLGGMPVEISLPVNRDSGGWKIASATSKVDLGSAGRTVNGHRAAANVVELFPGSYRVGPASSYVTLEDPELVITAPDPLSVAAQNWSGGKASLTPQGREAVLSAARTSLSGCLSKKSLTPEGCPIAIQTGPEITVDTATIKYTLLNSPWSEAELGLENDSLAKGTIDLAFRIDAAAKSKGVEGVVAQSYEQQPTFTADLSGAAPVITWQ